MCINLSWNGPGQRCQRDAERDAAFMEQYGEALREEVLTVAPGAEKPAVGEQGKTTDHPNTDSPAKANTPNSIMRSLSTAAFLFAGLIAIAQTPASPQAITLAKDGALVVDVREPDELAQMAYDAPNVVNIPLGEVAKRANEIPKDKPVVVVCRSGGRSAHAIGTLQGLGYTNLVNLEGGINAWQEAGMPVKKGGAAAGACCAGGNAKTSCSPAQMKAGCCSSDAKATEPAPSEKQRKRKK